MPAGGGGTSKGSSSSAILIWLQRNSSADQSGNNSTPRVAWKSYLVRQVGSDGSMADLEKQWLRIRIAALGGSAAAGSGWNDLWGQYLTLKGFTGQLDDQFAQWIDHGTA